MYSLCEIFKHCEREVLLMHISVIFDEMEMILTMGKQYGRVFRKFATKLIQRIGLVYLKPVVAKWRYKKQRHLLLPDLTSEANPYDLERYETENKSNSSNKDSNETKSEETEVNNEDENEDDGINFSVPVQIEPILDQLLNCLRSRDGIVRWSAAKGIGMFVFIILCYFVCLKCKDAVSRHLYACFCGWDAYCGCQ